jgi:NAD(P)-dependent dehydrogenase (short-subunit alcohol dehydrogenase family)
VHSGPPCTPAPCVPAVPRLILPLILRTAPPIRSNCLHVHAHAVCNVGTNTQLPTLEYTQEDYNRIIGTNFAATFALCQEAQPLLAAGARGSSSSSSSSSAGHGHGPVLEDALIVLVSSVAGGPLAGRSGSLYAASKAALNQLAASLAVEWAPQRIRVNSVAPWVTLTELGKQARAMCVCMCVYVLRPCLTASSLAAPPPVASCRGDAGTPCCCPAPHRIAHPEPQGP